MEQYNKAIDIDSDNAVFYNNRGLAYAHLGQYDNALNDLIKAIDLDRNDPRSYFNRGDIYCSLK